MARCVAWTREEEAGEMGALINICLTVDTSFDDGARAVADLLKG